MSKYIHTNHQIKSVIWKQREWFSTESSLFDRLFTSAHLELLHAAIQDFSSRFATVDRIVHFLIGHCCILTIYSYVFLSRWYSCSPFLCTQSHLRRVLRVSNKQSLLRLSGQIHTKLSQNGQPGEYPRKHCQFSHKRQRKSLTALD